METRSHWSTTIAIVICSLSLSLAIAAASSKSASYDEPKHVATGAYAWVEGEFLGDDNAPVVALFGWPAVTNHWTLPPIPRELSPTGKRLGLYDAGVAMLSSPTNGDSVVTTLLGARLTSIAVFALLLLLVALEGRARGGVLGMVLAVGLVGFSPVMLSHASIVSADLPLAVAGVLVAGALRRYDEQPSIARGAWLGVALGVALVTKLTGVVFALGCAILLLPRLLRSANRRMRWKEALVTAAACFIVITIATHFDPAFFFRQWRLVSNYGIAHQTEFFCGTLGARSPWFYPAVLALKLEPAMLIAIASLAIASIQQPHRLRSATPVLMLALLVLVITCASGYRQGFRFLLPMWPLLAVSCAHACSATIAGRCVVAASVLCGTTTAWSIAPDFLTYWNPLTRGSGDSWFVDSNHDWGQDLSTLATWQSQHPDSVIYGALYSIVPPSAYGIRFVNLFDDPAKLGRFDPNQHNVLMFSVTLLRMIAADSRQPLHAIARALVLERPDVELGGSIRGYQLTNERMARLMNAR